MKAELTEGGLIILEPETEYERNFIEYWGTKKYTIDPKIRFPEDVGLYLFLSEKMPERGVTGEVVAEWVKLKEEQEAKRLSHQAPKDIPGGNNDE